MRNLNITIYQTKSKKYMENKIFELVINREETLCCSDFLMNCTDYQLKLLLKATKELSKNIKAILSE